jgi:hypothetical protein
MKTTTAATTAAAAGLGGEGRRRRVNGKRGLVLNDGTTWERLV